MQLSILFQSPYLFFALCLPRLFSTSVHCPRQQGTRWQSTDRDVPEVFSFYCLLLSPFVSFPSCPLFLPSFFISCRFSQAACRCCWGCPLSHIFPHLWYECLEVCISTMTASYMALSSSSLPPNRHPNTNYTPLVHTRPQTHYISHINTVPKNTDAIELLSMPSCIVCQ